MREDKNKWILSNPDNPQFYPKYPTIGLTLWHRMKELGDSIAQIDSETGQVDTYEELLSRSVRTALALQTKGITPDDIISICAYNQQDTWVPMLAAFFLNIRMAPIDPGLSPENAMHILNITKPRILFCAKESEKFVETVIKNISLDCEIVVFGESEKHTEFKEFLNDNEEEDNFKPKEVDQMSTAIILFSSGTTGKAKAVCLNHFALLYQIQSFMKNRDFSVVLFFSSPYWISNTFFKMGLILYGGHHILAKLFDIKTILKIIETYKVTIMFLPPACIHTMNTEADWKSYDTSSLKSFISGGSCIAEEQIRLLRKNLPTTCVNNVYGMTECTSMCTMFDEINDREMMIDKTCSAGKVAPGFIIKVVDVTTREIVGPNQRGELLVKGKYMMNGYYKNPKQTEDSFDDDGFYRSGDIVYYDEDFYFYVVDRLKEVFKFKSFRIIPAELEVILLSHPDVAEAVVIGIPHEIDGDWPMGVVVLRPGATSSQQHIIDFYNSRVIDICKLRAGIKIVKSLCKTSTGKYSRFMQRNLILSGK